MPKAQPILAAAIVVSFVAASCPAPAKPAFQLLASLNNTNGGEILGGVILDREGNLFGMAAGGGADADGTVFEVPARGGTPKLLYSFAIPHIYQPNGSLLLGKHGELYGTANLGGRGACGGVFRLTKGEKFRVLHAFAKDGIVQGCNPIAGLVQDGAGNLYGTAANGGAYQGGTVYKLAPDNSFTVLHAFGNGSDGYFPADSLILDSGGNLYGTTEDGGAGGNGTVFKIAPDGTETILHAFTGTPDGSTPFAGLTMDGAGNLYGTTGMGGSKCGCGTIFKVAPDGTETVLYNFGGLDGGPLPLGGLVLDSSGNLYGTTGFGGTQGAGSVFVFTPGHGMTTLHSFSGTDGDVPAAGLTVGKHGELYGTTEYGGASDDGAIFSVTP